MQPLSVSFRSQVELTIHTAFLPSAGVLQCDPVATVHVTTVKRLHTNKNNNNNSGGGVAVTVSAKEVGRTTPRLFTAHPSFEETLSFDVEDHGALTSLSGSVPSQLSGTNNNNNNETETVEDYIVISLHDASSKRFLGEAYAPFSPHCTSSAPATAPVRVMLQPRNCHVKEDPLFLQDMAVLNALMLDDFGFVSISWRVVVLPHGGGLMTTTKNSTTVDNNNNAAVSYPLGLSLKALWLAPPEANERGVHFSTAVGFGGSERFVFEGNGKKPLFLTIRSAAQLQRVCFYCTATSITQPEQRSADIAVPLPLPSVQQIVEERDAMGALDRDMHWTAPVRTPQGRDFGILLASIRLSRRAMESQAPPCPTDSCALINSPTHQEEYSHTAKDFGRGATLPDTPSGAYQPIVWESAEHVVRATERQWKRSCIQEAKPSIQHVRHVFDVLMGRAQLDADVARVAGAFFNRPPTALDVSQLKEFMVAAAFNVSAKGFSVTDAARFCFVALRRDVVDAVSTEEIYYMFEHALVGKTVEMPLAELRRWVHDVVGDVPTVSFKDYTAYILHNYALWAAFGVPLTVDASLSSAQRKHVADCSNAAAAARDCGVLFPVPIVAPAAAAAAAAASPYAVTSSSSPLKAPATAALAANEWRTFVVRIPATKKGFTVTAHAKDAVRDVMNMVAESAGISANRQEWRLNGETVLDGATIVGSTTLGLPPALKHGTSSPSKQTASPTAAAAPEVWVREIEEMLSVSLLYKTKNKKWIEKLAVSDKVLKLRAAVQRKTLVPLSRCAMQLVRAKGGAPAVLHDRHALSHYNILPGDVVEVTQE